MPIYIALLRAVNVGGTGKLPMNELKSILNANPFPNAEPSKATVLFLDRKAKQSDITDTTGVHSLS